MPTAPSFVGVATDIISDTSDDYRARVRAYSAQAIDINDIIALHAGDAVIVIEHIITLPVSPYETAEPCILRTIYTCNTNLADAVTKKPQRGLSELYMANE